MKNIKFLGLTAAMFAMVLSGCQKPGTEYRTRNFAYLSELSAINGLAYEKAIGSNETGTEFEFSVDLIDYAVEDLDVTVNVDAALVSGYNDANGTEYTAVPNANITFSGEGVSSSNGSSATVTIKGGENRGTIKVNVTKWGGMIVDKEYAIIASISGSSEQTVVSAPGQWGQICFPVVLLNGPLNDALPTSPLATDGGYANFGYMGEGVSNALYSDLWNACFMGDYTLEVWLRPDVFGENFQIFSNRQQMTTRDGKGGMYQIAGGPNMNKTTKLGDADEFFVRFTGTGTAQTSPCKMEIKAFGGSGEQAGNYWRAKEWNHLAIVFNKRHNTLYVYRNGEQIAKRDGYPTAYGRYIGPDPVPATLDAETHFDHAVIFPFMQTMARHTAATSSHMALRELRVWNSARRATQIRDNMRVKVDPAEPNLVAYWPLDKASMVDNKFLNKAEWEGTDDIPVASSLTQGMTPASWGEVDFATAPLTDMNGQPIAQ